MEPASATSLLATSSIHERIELWRRGLQMFWEHPLLGAGPMHFSYYVDIPKFIQVAAPHNLTVQLLAEWGLVCTLFFYANVLWLFGRTVACLRQRQSAASETENTASLVLLAAWVAMLIAAQTSGTNLLMLAGLSGTLAGLIGKGQDEKSSRRMERFSGAVLSALVVGLLLNSVYPEIGCRREEAAAYLKEFPVQKAVAPRFWSQGKIAFSQRYLPQCYKDAGQRLANLGWHRNAQLEKTRQQAE